jgi:hypothetical protein
LSYLSQTDGYEDGNGDYHEGTSEWRGYIPCNAVPAGKAAERTFEDGKVRAYSYTVNLNTEIDFQIGDRVRIEFLNGKVREFGVKGFHRYQLQCKMWV